MRKLIALIGALCLPAAAHAAGFDYSYLDLAYTRVNIDLHSGGNGYRLEGIYAFSENGFMEGLFSHNSFGSSYNDDADVYHGQVGVGAHTAISGRVDFYALVALSKGRFEDHNYLYSYDDNKTGIGLTLGLRTRLADPLELDAALEGSSNAFWSAAQNHGNVASNIDGQDTAFRLGLRYAAADRFSLGAGYAIHMIGTHQGATIHAREWLVSARVDF